MQKKLILALCISIAFFSSCNLVEIDIAFETDTTGIFTYRYMISGNSSTMLDLDNISASEPLFPFSTEDFDLLGQLIDGIEVSKISNEKTPDGGIQLTAEYTFRSLPALGAFLSYMGLDINSTKRGRLRELTIRGTRTKVPEVDQLSNITRESQLYYWHQARFAKLLFPDLVLQYKLRAPKKIINSTKGKITDKVVLHKENIADIPDNPARFVWRIQW